MARNKIIYGNETLIDLSGDTAQESDVAQGKTFHKADGSQATGTATGGGTAITPSNESPVPLTKDSGYVIENNDGYAIKNIASVINVDSSVTPISIPKDTSVISKLTYTGESASQVVDYGYVSDCSDLGADSFDIIYDKKYIGKGGVKRTGTRPQEYLYSANYSSDGSSNPIRRSKVFRFFKSFNIPYLGNTRLIFKSGKAEVYLLRSSDDKSALLSLTNPETGVESTITIASPGTAYIDTFEISNMHLVHANHFIIEYSYDTSATARSQTYARSILIKNNYTLAQSSAINTSTASSATTSVNSYFMQTLYGDYFSFFCLRSVITDSTAAWTLTGWKTWMSTFTGAFTNASSNSINIASNINTNTSVYNKRAPSKGGFFYRNASDVDYICLIGHYSDSGVKNMTLEAADSSGSLASAGYSEHYILGLSNGGYLVTAQFRTSYWIIRVWRLDLSASSDILTFIGSATIQDSASPSYVPNIISFNNNIFILSSGKKYQLVEDFSSSASISISIRILNESAIESTVMDTKFIGPLGDPYNMVGVY